LEHYIMLITFFTLRKTQLAMAAGLALLAAGCGGGGADERTASAMNELSTPAAGENSANATATAAVDANTIAEVGRLIDDQAETLREHEIAPDAVGAEISRRVGTLPVVVHTRVFEAGQVRTGTELDRLDQRDSATYNAAGGSIVVYGRAGAQVAIEDLRLLVQDDRADLFRDLYLDPGSDHVFIGRSMPAALAGDQTARVQAQATAAPAPGVTGIGGATIPSADIKDGVLVAGCGKSFNGALVVNDEAGITPWQIRGKNFGTVKGKVYLNNRELSSQWTNTLITIDPTMPWSTPFLSPNLLKIVTAGGTATTWVMNIAPAIKGRPYGQCTHYVAVIRNQLGLKPSPSAYGSYKAFDATYKPQVGDQYQINGKHTWIATRVSAPVTSSNGVTRWPVRIAEQNHTCKNSIATLDTSFAIQKTLSGTKVIARPKTRAYTEEATSYYR